MRQSLLDTTAGTSGRSTSMAQGRRNAANSFGLAASCSGTFMIATSGLPSTGGLTKSQDGSNGMNVHTTDCRKRRTKNLMKARTRNPALLEVRRRGTRRSQEQYKKADGLSVAEAGQLVILSPAWSNWRRYTTKHTISGQKTWRTMPSHEER